jgi:peptidoglycan hydrolase FlgJ
MAGLDPRTSLDYRALDSLKRDLRTGDAATTRDATKIAAKKFEAEFLNLLMKQMRAALPQEDPLNSDTSRSWQAMADQRMTEALSQRGVGLADMIEKQLTRNRGIDPAKAAALAQGTPPVTALNPGAQAVLASGTGAGEDPIPLGALKPTLKPALKPLNLNAMVANAASAPMANPRDGAAAAPTGNVQGAAPAPAGTETSLRRWVQKAGAVAPTIGQRVNAGVVRQELGSQRAFVEKVSAEAKTVAAQTGLPAEYMVGQAALESGWGRSEIKAADGTQSFNLFGIKAGRNWTGKTIEVTTTEYINGAPQKVKAKFRAYDSYAEGFADYAKLIQNNPRYAGVRQAGSATEFARALQQGGYATDPAYAQKLAGTIQSAQRISWTLA